jgi:UDP-hydrolysing UDP-N-acetyl-D-glucosamine 2-epimerase
LELNISICTGSRAEYGILHPLIKAIDSDPEINLDLIVTGMHLSSEFGETWKDIVNDGFFIDAKIPMRVKGDNADSIAKAVSDGVANASEYFNKKRPDILIVLGDRYEIFSVVQAALFHKIPIAHIHGGEVTEGAVDESMRHAITKMSNIHFTSSDIYKKRVIQLGELPERVFNIGYLSIEAIKNTELHSKNELSEIFNIDFNNDVYLITFHPETSNWTDNLDVIKNIVSSTEAFDSKLVITKSNADEGGTKLNEYLDSYAGNNKNRVVVRENLGTKKYYSVMKQSKIVIGNSSSGIIEAPVFGVPTVNIGDRQKGRVRTQSIVDCKTDKKSIIGAINEALQLSTKVKAENENKIINVINSSEQIINVLKSIDLKNITQKKFYDI